ncbi:MAG: tyrosine-type recombinase/integrase [Bifidobacterium mongoliense]|jgi:integrase|uniref:tyrosine-type recombinase/integrase n=1 Tax=Bifidobacterium mongoliense TaxID=518643 RepID=UPI002F35099E
MARRNTSGIIRPYKRTTRHTLSDGTVRTYIRYEAKIDMGEDADGKRTRRTVTAKTYRECLAKVNDVLKDKREWGAAVPTSIKLGPYAEEWLSIKKTSSDPSTYRGYMTCVRRHLAPYAGKPIRDFTPTICRRILNQMQAYNQKGEATGQASISSRRTLHTALNQIFKNALADRLIPSNPMIAVQRPHAKDNEIGKSAEREAFTIEQMQTMLSKAADMGPEKGAIWWWRLLTGMRQGEILGASLEDLIFGKTGDKVPYGQYAVNWKLEQIMREHGCGDPVKGVYPCHKKRPSFCTRPRWRVPDGYDITPLWGRWCLTRPKSKTGRIVPIIPLLAQVMQSYLKATADQPNPYGLIFHRPDGRPIEPDDDERGFRQLMELAGIPDPKSRTGHETRHSTVSLLSSMGVDVGLIMQIVGHSSIAMVEHYRHADITERLDAMETMDEKLDLKAISWAPAKSSSHSPATL